MRKVFIFAISAFLLTGTLMAAEEHDHNVQQAQTGESMAPGMMMGLLTHEQMMGMREHMQDMREIMEKIQEENDPTNREELMSEHMESMNEGMRMMGGSKMGMTGNGDLSAMDMGERMNLMQEQMGMMQIMMEQLMIHYSEEDNLNE